MKVHIGSVVLLLAAATTVRAELKQETVQAWDSYIHNVEQQTAHRAEEGTPFLWTDEDSRRMERVRKGEIVVSRMDPSTPRSVPGGLIHDWVGAAFYPGVTLHDVFAIVRNYDRYKEFYPPTVVASKVLSRHGEAWQFQMRWVRNVLWIKSGIEAEYEAHYIQLDRDRWYSVAYSTRVQEIVDCGRPSERMLPPGEGNGYIWRLYSVSRYVQRDGGVYVELEAIALTRDIPRSLRWLVKPLVSRLSRDSVLVAITQTHDALQKSTGATAHGAAE